MGREVVYGTSDSLASLFSFFYCYGFVMRSMRW